MDEGYHKMKKLMKKEGSEERGLELRLGPPGVDDATHGAKRAFSMLQPQPQPQPLDNKPNYRPSAILFQTSDKRVAQSSALVGWPPVRSSRKNIVTHTNSNKAASLLEKLPKDGKKLSPNNENSLFVKINMDGVPIGRKVDLKAYDNYQTLSSAVDQLFRGLLAAQEDASCGLIKKQRDAIVGLLDGNGEYTLVYEDNEGDRILVGDVPWDMFISSAKRLRVLKRSELSIFHHKSK